MDANAGARKRTGKFCIISGMGNRLQERDCFENRWFLQKIKLRRDNAGNVCGIQSLRHLRDFTISATQDGDGTPWDALLRMQRCNVCGDGSIFCFYRRKPKESGLHALCLRLEILGNAIRIPFRDAIFVALNDRGSSMENRLATAKTFRKSDSNRVRKTLKESDHILHACPLKPVDRLIVVSDDAEIGLMRCNDIPCEKIEYLILCAVQVLKLISNHILILLLQTDQQPFMLPQHLERHQDHVIGVVAMGAPQRIDVTTVDGNEFLKLLHATKVIFIGLRRDITLFPGLGRLDLAAISFDMLLKILGLHTFPLHFTDTTEDIRCTITLRSGAAEH